MQHVKVRCDPRNEQAKKYVDILNYSSGQECAVSHLVIRIGYLQVDRHSMTGYFNLQAHRHHDEPRPCVYDRVRTDTLTHRRSTRRHADLITKAISQMGLRQNTRFPPLGSGFRFLGFPRPFYSVLALLAWGTFWGCFWAPSGGSEGAQNEPQNGPQNGPQNVPNRLSEDLDMREGKKRSEKVRHDEIR